jgi:hypothetical protein
MHEGNNATQEINSIGHEKRPARNRFEETEGEMVIIGYLMSMGADKRKDNHAMYENQQKGR